MAPDEPVSRREMDQLREDVHRLDDHGTRGVAAMQSQLTDVIKDILELKSEVSARFDAHQRVHERDEAQRVASRRWAVGTFLIALGIVVTLLLNITFHLR